MGVQIDIVQSKYNSVSACFYAPVSQLAARYVTDSSIHTTRYLLKGHNNILYLKILIVAYADTS
jgi:hypothetical protein